MAYKLNVTNSQRTNAASEVQNCKGQVMPEYVIAVALLSLVLVIGPNSPLEQLFNAFAGYYGKFTYAISRP